MSAALALFEQVGFFAQVSFDSSGHGPAELDRSDEIQDRQRAGQENLCATVGHICAARSAGVVEPVFDNICVHKHMDRFTLRSKRKVDVQWARMRFALVHNIGKIHVFGALI